MGGESFCLAFPSASMLHALQQRQEASAGGTALSHICLSGPCTAGDIAKCCFDVGGWTVDPTCATTVRALSSPKQCVGAHLLSIDCVAASSAAPAPLSFTMK